MLKVLDEGVSHSVTPLWCAAVSGRLAVVKVLLRWSSHVVCGSSLQSMIVIQSISIASQWDCSGTAPMWTQSRTPGRRQWGRRATLWGRERTRGSHLCHYSLLWHHHYWKEHHQLVRYPARWSFSFTLGPLHWISNIQSGFQRTLNYSAVMY